MRKLIVFFILALLVTAFAMPAMASAVDDLVLNVDYGSISYSGDVAVGDKLVSVFDSSNVLLGQQVVAFDGTDRSFNVPFIYMSLECDLSITFTPTMIYGDLLDPSPAPIIDFVGFVVISDPVSASEPVSPSAGVLSVFSSIGAYLISGLTSLLALFWTGTSLTFLGVLAVCALAIAVILLLVLLIIRNARGY